MAEADKGAKRTSATIQSRINQYVELVCRPIKKGRIAATPLDITKYGSACWARTSDPLINSRCFLLCLGRMLSPDPVTFAPEDAQGYNRYSYVLNNPLNNPLRYTDSSGYSPDRKVVPEEVIVNGKAAGLSGVVGNQAAATHAGGGSGGPRAMAGDYVTSTGEPIQSFSEKDEKDAKGTNCGEDKLECSPTTYAKDLRNQFWRDVGDRAGWGSLLFVGVTVACPHCAPFSGPLSLGLTIVSAVAHNLGDEDSTTVAQNLGAGLLENALNSAMAAHPILNKIPYNIRKQFSATVGFSISGAGVVQDIGSRED